MLLGREILDDRLEHEVAVAQLTEVGDRAHPGEHGVAFAGVELAPLDLLGERLLEPGDHGVGGALSPAAQHDLDPGLGRDLRDARAHDPGTHDANPLDRHQPLLAAVGRERLPAGSADGPGRPHPAGTGPALPQCARSVSDEAPDRMGNR